MALPIFHPAGGSQLKVLARHHAELILEIVDSRPDLVDYFRTTWIPDETMIPSLLTSPAFGARWESSHLPGAAWYIDWGKQPNLCHVRTYLGQRKRNGNV